MIPTPKGATKPASPLVGLSRALAPNLPLATSSKEAVAGPESNEKEIGNSLEHIPMRVVASIVEDGLGLLSWWSAAEAEEEESEG